MDQLSVDPSERPHQNIISVYAVIDWILFPTPTVISGLILSRHHLPLLHKTRKGTQRRIVIRIVVFQSYRCFFYSFCTNVTRDRVCDDRFPIWNYFIGQNTRFIFLSTYYLIVNKYCLFYDSLRWNFSHTDTRVGKIFIFRLNLKFVRANICRNRRKNSIANLSLNK